MDRRIGAGRLAGTGNSAIPDTLALVVEPVELDVMMESKGKLEMDESNENKNGMLGIRDGYPMKTPKGGIVVGNVRL